MTRAARGALLALGLVAFSLRCAFLIDYDEDIDALRFALGVERFDVATLRPHAPFYPVYVAAAKLVAALGVSPRVALGLVNALAGSLAVVATALLAREVLGRRAAWLAGLLALASPFLWLTSQKLLSDMAGAAVFTIALFLCARARRKAGAGGSPEGLRTAAVVLLGVGLGVRLSYFPIALACVGVVAATEGGGRAYLARVRDLCAGVVVWLVPLVVFGGSRALVRTTWAQAAGHFTVWGGTVATVSSPVDRLRGMLWGLWANVLGGAWPDAPVWRWLAAPILLGLLAVAARAVVGDAHAWVRRHPELVVSAAAYFVWAALGQNTAHKPRHFLPLAPLLMVALAAGGARLLERHRLGAVALALLFVQWLADGAGLARKHQVPSPAAAVVQFLRAGGEANRPVWTCDLGRMIAEGSPGRTVVRVADRAEVPRILESAGPEGLLLTSECLSHTSPAELTARGIETRVVFRRTRSRYVDPLWAELSLLERRKE